MAEYALINNLHMTCDKCNENTHFFLHDPNCKTVNTRRNNSNRLLIDPNEILDFRPSRNFASQHHQIQTKRKIPAKLMKCRHMVQKPRAIVVHGTIRTHTLRRQRHLRVLPQFIDGTLAIFQITRRHNKNIAPPNGNSVALLALSAFT